MPLNIITFYYGYKGTVFKILSLINNYHTQTTNSKQYNYRDIVVKILIRRFTDIRLYTALEYSIVGYISGYDLVGYKNNPTKPVLGSLCRCNVLISMISSLIQHTRPGFRVLLI